MRKIKTTKQNKKNKFIFSNGNKQNHEQEKRHADFKFTK